MKHFILVLVSVVTVLSLLSFSCFASSRVVEDVLDEPASLRSIPVTSSNFTYVFDTTVTDPGSSRSMSFTCNGVDYVSIGRVATHLFYYTSSNTSTPVYYFETGWVDDSFRTINITERMTNSTTIDWLNANSYYKVLPDVSSAISYTGNVLDFIIDTPLILALLGLAVGLTLVPFGIGKVKDLIKGY